MKIEMPALESTTPADSGRRRQGLAGGWREARGMVLGVAPRTYAQIKLRWSSSRKPIQ